MSYNNNSFTEISNKDIVAIIENINNTFNANLPINTTAKSEGWKKRKNVEVVSI